MNKLGEIIIVDDDQEDRDLLCEAFKELKIENKLLCFDLVSEALEYLRKFDSDPFYIISDFRMPPVNGLEFRQMIYTDESLINKAIPFILYSTTIDSRAFNMALAVGVQGFFLKPSNFEALKEKMSAIHAYLTNCLGN